MILEFNNVETIITPENDRELNDLAALARLYRLSLPEARYSPEHKKFKESGGKKGWDGTASVVKQTGGHYHFPTGLVTKMLTHLDDVQLVDKRYIRKVNLQPHNLQLRDYQQAAYNALFTNVENGMWWPRGVLHLATGAGKTEVAVALIKSCKVNTLFLVHLKGLLGQAKSRLEKYGVVCGSIGDGNFDIKTVTVSTIQTLSNIVKDKKDPRHKDMIKYLGTVEQTIFDEAHLIGNKASAWNQFASLAANLEKSYIRVGLSATPFMSDHYSNLILEGVVGRTVYEKRNKSLTAEGVLAKVTVRMVTVPFTWEIKGRWQDVYEEGIVSNQRRNALIIDQIPNLPKPCMILVNRKHQLDLLQAMGTKQGLKMMALHGGNSSEDRELVLEAFVKNRYDALICTTIFDEGMDVPSIASLILGGGGKSEVKLLQRVGRGMRKTATKDSVIIVDFIDKINKNILWRHSRERMAVYRAEGFDIEFV
jgi:superfamily II DNA or RNA helicase